MFTRVGLVVFAFLSAVSLADASRYEGTWVGKGEWKTPEGVMGTYTSEMTMSGDEKGFSVKEKIVVNSPKGEKEVMENEWSATPGKAGFFNVVTKDKKTSKGFCFRNECMMEGMGDKAGSHFSEYLRFEKRRIFRVGYDDSGEVVAWKGFMVRKKP